MEKEGEDAVKAKRRLRVVRVVSITVVLAAAVGYNVRFVRAEELASGLDESSQRLVAVTQSLSPLIEEGRALLDSTEADDVADEAVLTALSEAVDRAVQASESAGLTYEDIDVSVFDTTAIEVGIESNKAGQSEAAESFAALDAAISAVEDSVSLKDAQDAFASLQSARDDAQDLYDETKGKVSDDSTREALADAIAAADEALTTEPVVDGADAYQEAKAALTEASDAVEESHEKWDAAQKAAAEAARANSSSSSSSSGGSSSSGSSSSSSSSGSGGSSTSYSSAWHVSYVSYSQANLDAGYVCQWKSGYYVAHNWSSGGGMIASRPSYVVVNGVTYRYVSEQLVSQSTTWGQVEGFVHANGGIGFQTCSGDYYLITHYEPV